MHILLTLTLSFAVGLLFRRRHIPAGMMIGAVLAAAVLSLLGLGAVPDSTKHIAQIIAGTFIGCSASRDDFQKLLSFRKPVLVITLSLFLVNLAIGFSLYATGYGDLLTCLVCAVPGGIADVTLIALDFGADASKVLAVHFCRLVVGLMVFPLVVARFTGPIPEERCPEEESAGQPAMTARTAAIHLLTALSVSTAAALAGNALHIPAASILCSLVATFILNFSGYTIRFPGKLRQVAQLLSGACVGCLLNPGTFSSLGSLATAVLITAAVLLLNAFFFGKLMQKHYAIPLREGMLMLTPAGASDMALIADDLGFKSPRLVLVQLYRLIVATAIFPQLCLAISRLFS